jgi:hypothetical protein
LACSLYSVLMASRGAEAAHPEGDGALAACVVAGHAGTASCAQWLLLTVVVTLGYPRVKEGRAAAGVRPVVDLPEVVLCTRLDGALAACVAAGHAGAASRSPRLLLTVVVTLGCLRVNEVARLQVCYLWFNYLMSDSVPGFEGTCSAPQQAEECHAAQGPLPTFGRSRYPELDVSAQLRRWLELAGLAVHPSRAGEGTAAGRACMPSPAVLSEEG